MKKIYKIHPISKFNHTVFSRDVSLGESLEKDHEYIDLSHYFWLSIFDNSYLLKKFLEFHKKNLWNQNLRNSLKMNFAYLLDSIKKVRTLFSWFVKHSPQADEVIFWYRIMTELLVLHNSMENDWNIDLANGLTYIKNNFSSDNPDLSHIQSIVREWELHSPYRFIQSIFEKRNIHNSIVVIDFYWPGELLQILMMCDILKKQWNIIIIDASNGNEQFDFTQWIKVFSQRLDLFDSFDYFLIYQDYGQSLRSLIESIQNNQKADHTIANVMSKDWDSVFFQAPKRNLWASILRENFISYYFSKKNIYTIAGAFGVTVRLLPYKCYWSACNFCAINSTNLYAFHWDAYKEINEYIESCISFIKENDIHHIIFTDEAIHPEVIQLFSERVLESKLDIRYQFRTRFEYAYTQDVCKKLYASGVRYCGIWLETAIDRLEWTINKWLGSIPIHKKQDIIHSFNSAGICLHNYAIFGFPSETEEESVINAKFLITNIKNLHHYTCTPNILSLMRGTNYFTQAKRFGIEVSFEETSEFSLNYNFRVDGKKRNFSLYQKLANKIHMIQFLPWIQESRMNAFHFWTFIDRTGLFYLMKRLYKTNPYFEYWKWNIAYLNKDPRSLWDKKFRLALGNQWIQQENDSKNIVAYNWISDRSVLVPMVLKNFISNYEINVSLDENIVLFPENQRDIILENIPKLLEARIFLI